MLSVLIFIGEENVCKISKIEIKHNYLFKIMP